jgi:hypothetical protein
VLTDWYQIPSILGVLEFHYFTRHAKSVGAMDSQFKLALEAQTKLFLAELDKKFAAHDTNWEARIVDLEHAAVSASDKFYDLKADIHTDVAAQLEFHLTTAADRADRVAAATETRVAALESASVAFDSWCPVIESTTDDIKHGVNSVQAVVARIASPSRPEPRDPPHLQPGILGAYGSAAARTPVGPTADGPMGHRVDSQSREADFGRVFAQTHLLHNGTPDFGFPSYIKPPELSNHPDYEFSPGPVHGSQFGPLPKVPFPQFDGEHPRLWLGRAQDYFDIYFVDPKVWIRVATMHFTGAAARWFQSMATPVKHCSWAEFSHLVLERFGRDQYEHLIRQLFHIRQTSTIAAYIEEFSGLVDQLAAYQSKTDPLFYTMCFIDGLKEHIKVVFG